MYNLGNADKNMLAYKNVNNKYYDSNIEIDINDDNNTHSIIARQIYDNAICLDVGCGSGYIGKLLKNTHCDLYGIDSDEEALKVTSSLKCYKELYSFSITDEENKEYKEFIKKNVGKFDFIFFADVLEHVTDPGKVLFNFSKLLSENGKFLISVPNIAHFDIIKELVNRTFNYNSIGLLDNTHVTFFTKNSFYEFIDGVNEIYNLNFGVKIIGKTISEPWYINNYPKFLELVNDDNEICVLQYVYELAKKEKKVKKRNVVYTEYFDRIEQKLDSLEKENDDLHNKISSLSADLQYYKQNLEETLNSKSWKITKPLRKISGIRKNK